MVTKNNIINLYNILSRYIEDHERLINKVADYYYIKVQNKYSKQEFIDRVKQIINK